MQFFCSEEHALAWRSAGARGEGFLITFEQSARICRAFYGDLGGAPHPGGGAA